MQEVLIFTDGACKGNPGRGGWGAIVADGERVVELGGGEKRTTNNRMELTGAIEALSYAQRHARGPAVVHTDSSYVINGITKWVAGWQARGWVTQKKEPVLNLDLWQKLVAAVEAYPHGIAWEYVGGHVGIAGNERVDSIASDFAEGKKVALYSGARATYSVDVANMTHDSAKQKTKSASRTRASGRAYSYVSRVDGVTLVHQTWAECEARVRGKKARYKKAMSAAEEAAIVEAFSHL